MAKQDDYIRITLRLPQELHAQLLSASGAKSLNAEICDRLEQSFATPEDKIRGLIGDERYSSIVNEAKDSKLERITPVILSLEAMKKMIEEMQKLTS